MSDWEIALRNAIKEAYPDVQIRGCWFHFTQNVWHHIQKLGFVQTFNTNHDFSAYVRKLMSILFLPTYNILNPPITFPEIEKHKLRKFVMYFTNDG